MTSNLDKFREDLDRLIKDAGTLYFTILYNIDILTDEQKKKIEKHTISDFRLAYEKWYSESLYVVKQIIPERLDDFIKLYKNEKRKELNNSTYTMSDYQNGVTVTRGSTILVGLTSALPKFEIQKGILQSALSRFESSLFDIKQLVQADLFDSELDSSRELTKNGFLRGAGAVAGVVLEKHLGHVAINHHIKTRKKHPSISDFNNLLKQEGVLNVPTWRQIQRLSDLRNLCDHNKQREPTKEEVMELIDGVEKITKTLF
jgi:hypothetical protein